METRRNRRRVEENFVSGRHLHLSDLRQEAQARRLGNQYLYKGSIPAYPRPEVHVSRLRHDTDRSGLFGVRRDEGFGSYDDRSLLWWSLAPTPEDLAEAEARPVGVVSPDGAEEPAQVKQGSLEKFATSPAFLDTSRLGSYRFTFPVEEVLGAYSEQFCSGAPPVMQVFETVLYKQEVMYVVLVSPANQGLPSLSDDPRAVCAYRDGRFIWRPEAMCETHKYELVQTPGEEQMEAEVASGRHQFYVWDNVAIALAVEEGRVLKFDAGDLRENLRYCDPGEPALGSFDTFEEAKTSVRSLWPGDPAPLEKEGSPGSVSRSDTSRSSAAPQRLEI